MSLLDERIVDTSALDPERRDSYRMPKVEGTQQAKLKVGRKLIDVEVLDESAGGFLLCASKMPNTDAMACVELFNSTGAHFLRIAWRRNVDGVTRLGLQRQFHPPVQPESSWLIWVVAAIVIGIGIGFVAASGRHTNLLDQLLEKSHAISNSTIEALDTN